MRLPILSRIILSRYPPAMQIDVVSDTVCPWCYIGKRKLERALAMRPSITFDIRWRAYRLDPTIPREGVERKAYMKAKFGDGPRTHAIGEAIRAAGESEGIAFAFDRVEKRPETTDSHRLIRWAASSGKQDDIVGRLFKAYFEDGRDIGDTAVLAAIASEAGMDAELVEELLAKDSDRALIEQEDALAHRMGISGVPTFIFANKYLISGACEPERLVEIIDKANAEAV